MKVFPVPILLASSAQARAVLAAVLLPPAGFMSLALIGLVCYASVGVGSGLWLSVAALASLWLTSCNGVAVWLSRAALPQFQALQPGTWEEQLVAQAVEAVIMLGAGVDVHSPEYGAVQLSHQSSARLKYGAMLSRAAALPLGFAGGIGWTSIHAQGCHEAAAARVAALSEYGFLPRWAEEASRDTRGDAEEMAPHLMRDSVRCIALVTHVWQMPRAKLAFEEISLRVVPAPMGFIGCHEIRALEWFPSAHGLRESRLVLREWLALQVFFLRRYVDKKQGKTICV